MIETDPEKRYEQFLRMHENLAKLSAATRQIAKACVTANPPSYVEGYGMTYLTLARTYLDVLEKELLKE